MVNSKLVMIAVLLCVAIVVIGIVISLNEDAQNDSANIHSPTPKPIIDVKITNFNLTGYYNPVGVVWNDMFLLTYTNNGTTNVDNTTITFSTNSTFEMSREIDVFEPAPNLNNSIRSFVMGEPYSLGTIKANETKKFIGCIWNNLGDSSKVHGFAFTATLNSNDTLLDQETVMIPALV